MNRANGWKIIEQQPVLTDAKIPLPENVKEVISSQGSTGSFVVWSRATDRDYILLSQEPLKSGDHEFIGSYKIYEPARKSEPSSRNYQIRVPKAVSNKLPGFSEGNKVYYIAYDGWLEEENSRVYLLSERQFSHFFLPANPNTIYNSESTTTGETGTQKNPVDLKTQFINKHRDALVKVAETIENEDPDYILALTRRAPRLLEMMQDELNWPKSAPIITEKSVDFMPQKQLANKDVVLFDDVIISGSTIETTRKELHEVYPRIDIQTVTAAIDEETIALDKSRIDYKKSLTRSERFTFSRDIVRAISLLNKPYDTDYALLTTRFNHSALSDLSASDEAHNLTTLHQSQIGKQRYTFLFEEPLRDLTNSILVGEDIIDSITKSRLYYDGSTRRCTMAPMAIFSMGKDDIQNNIFAEPIARYNELIENVRGLLYTSEEEIAIYRFIWFIVSYLHGLAFSYEYSPEEEQLLRFSSPSDLFDIQDIVYLFGPEVAEKTLDFFDSHYTETEEALKSLCQSTSSKQAKNGSGTLQRDEALQFDEKQRETYKERRDEISEYITENLTTDASALSLIFEAMYTEIEIPEQRELRRGAEIQTPSQNRETLRERHKRLEAGLNYWQLQQILAEHGVSLDRETLSLTVDNLVDVGVQVPSFYEREIEIEGEKKSRLERVYRYGENVEERLDFPQIVDNSVEVIFDHLIEEKNKNHVNELAFEKMGVMLVDKITDIDQCWPEDILEPQVFQPLSEDASTVNAYTNHWKPAVEYNRHGRVLNINGSPFTDWAKKTGIIKEIPNTGGVGRCDNWKKNHSKEREFGVQPSSDSQLSSFKKLARCLIEIEEAVDPETGDYLTAITTCRNKRTLLKSMQKELQLFFGNQDWYFKNAIEKARVLERYDQLQNRVFVSPDSELYAKFEDDLNEWLCQTNRSCEVAYAIKHKHQLWSRLNEIIGEINEHFEDHNDFSLKNDYERELRSALYNMKSSKYPPEPGESLISKTEFFGKLCLSISSISQSLLKLGLCILDERHSDRVSNDTKKQIKELSEQIKEWNSYAQNEAKLKEEFSVDALPIIKEEKITLDQKNSENNDLSDFQDPRTSFQLLLDLWPQIETAYEEVESIYKNQSQSWEATIDELSRQEDWETLTHTWAIWYEVKDSTGKFNPVNEEQANGFEDQIEPHLKALKTDPDIDDGLWDVRDNSRYIFLEDHDNIPSYINMLLKIATNNGTFLQIGVSNIRYTDLKRHKRRGTLKSEESHKLVKSLGRYQKEDAKECRNCHSLNINKEAVNILGNSVYPSEFKEDWRRADISKDITKRFKDITTPITFDSVKLFSANSPKSKEDIEKDNAPS